MSLRYRAVRGMRDLASEAAAELRRVEDQCIAAARAFGYEEIRLPLVESTDLFSRGIGEATDIVAKEMYVFDDRRGNSLALRPEGTAGCVRACIQQGLLHNRTQRLWYAGPMFRYERPQHGRYRQFDQFGAEIFGVGGPEADAELMQMVAAIWDGLGLGHAVRLEINALGSSASRAAYGEALVAYLAPYEDELDGDSRQRLHLNPLRILDSKVESTRRILEEAPNLADYLDAGERAQFDTLRELLDSQGLSYRVNRRLVRGFDYYTHAVVEWVAEGIGSQDAVCAGGRYDGLIELFGGRPTPAAGFALGIDRVALLLREVADASAEASAACSAGVLSYSAADVHVVVQDRKYMSAAMAAAQALRVRVTDLRVRMDAGGGGLSAQFRRADRSGARWAMIVGEDEIAQNRVSLKWLRANRPQVTASMDEVAAAIRESQAQD
ncbi:MAG: histidine--tRNA ligase [Gammaproteobacteria bacterium]|nr:histidine--tRNA ligase [Gammaproteobacteria bacterium]